MDLINFCVEYINTDDVISYCLDLMNSMRWILVNVTLILSIGCFSVLQVYQMNFILVVRTRLTGFFKCIDRLFIYFWTNDFIV